MASLRSKTSLLAFALAACFVSGSAAWAQDQPAKELPADLIADEPGAAPAPSAEPAPAAQAPAGQAPAEEAPLAVVQERIADKYQRLEDLMMRLAEIEGASNPRRAALLEQAVQQSRDRVTLAQMRRIAQWLQAGELRRAQDAQTTTTKDVEALLELLLSENRPDRLKSEQDRVKEYIKELERLIRIQAGIKGQTQGGVDGERLAQLQEGAADRTGALDEKIASDEGSAAEGEQPPGEGEQPQGENQQPPSDGMPSDGVPSDGMPSDGMPSDGMPSDGMPSDGMPSDGMPSEGMPSEGMPSEGMPSEGMPSDGMPSDGMPSDGMPSEGMPSEGMPSEGMPSEGMPSEGSGEGSESESQSPPPGEQPQDENPARKRLKAAEKKMREAKLKLEEAKRREAIVDQEEAEAELRQAKAELEEILRQLREEEVERTLALLETRFVKMLEMQIKVYEDTRRIDRIPAEQRGPEVEIQTGKLAFDERKIVVEADQTLALLHEEGSSIAFPESVEQMREDMEQIAERLSAARADKITIAIEEDVIAALEDMIDAVRQAIKEAEENSQPPPPGQPGAPQDQPLVDKIAELKMIRNLQLRVNQRTDRYARLLDDADDVVGQATDAELQDALRKLSERERQIQKITRDIVLGLNQ